MTPARLRLDFERTAGAAGWLGGAVLALGILVAAGALLDYRSSTAEIAALELRHDSVAPRDRPLSPAVARSVEDARSAVHQLTTPWSDLLLELEAAGRQSKGSVALLTIEPDRDRGRVRIMAEARTLPAALIYVHRLQQGRALRGALLDQHEVQTKDPERPVRFQMTANWAISS
jgi:hypothetical protein